MNAPAHALRPNAAPRSAPETTRRSVSTAASPSAAAAATPRYLRTSLKLGGVNDPEEHEAEHAASVIAGGGCYQVIDPGGSTHLRAANAADAPTHDPIRKIHAEGAAPEPTRKMAAEGPPAHTPIRAAVAPPILDIGASGRVRRAVAPPILDLGASGRIRSAAAPATAGPSPDAAQMIERARASATRRLPPAVQARLERGFGQRMDNVGLHTGPSARAAARAIGARAYTEGERITLGPGESEHDVPLLAHEATHVVQNRRAAGVFRPLPADTAARRAPHDEVHRSKVRKTEAPKTEAPKTEIRKTEAPQAQPIRRVFGIDLPGLDTVLDKFADWANVIPWFRLFTIVLGMNPINRAKVDRSGANILRAAVELIPGGGLIVRALDTYGIFEKGGAWLEQQVATLGMVGSAIFDALMSFLHSTDLSDLVLHPGDSWDNAKRVFTEPIDRLIAFFKTAAQGFIDLIKDAVLKPLAALASKTPAWDLLCALLGKNPITNEPVPQDASAIIGALMKLAGQEEVWQNIQNSGALAKVAAWFGGAKADLIAFVEQIPALFVAALKSFVIEDLLDLPGAIGRVAGMFGDFAGKFIGWVGKSLLKLLEIVVTAVSPGAWAYIQKTGAALKKILKDPMPFVGNLVKAAKLGLQNFADNIGTHLKTGLISWLTGAVAGVYLPQALSLAEIGKFVMSVLGLAWTQVRGKIVKALGPTGEKIMSGLEKAADFIVALVTGGPAALWEMIKEKLTDLKDTVIEGIKDFVISTIVKAAIPKLVAMFIPGAGFVAALVSIYGTIKSFMEQLGKVAAAVMAFVDSIVAIAEGQIAGAAKKVESALAGVLSIAIGLLAGFLNLGNVSAKVMAVVKKVQTAVDKALDKAIAWLIDKAKKAFAWLFGKGDKKGAPDDAGSATVKKKAAAELAGKSVSDASEEKSLLSSVYSRLAPEGLAGLKFVPNPGDPGVLDVIASASIAEKVAQLDIGTKKGKQEFDEIVRSMTYYAGQTTMYVFYDLDHKQFGGAITSKRKDEGFGHAEHEFIDVFQYQLMPLIRLQRGQNVLKTPPGQKIPVHLDINRTPCDGCSATHLQEIVQVAQSAFSDVPIALSISSANLSTEKGAQPSTVGGLKKLLDAGVELSASTIWGEVDKQLKSHGIKTVEYMRNVYSADVFVSIVKGKSAEVQTLIDKAKAEQAKDKPVPVGAGNLQ